MVAPCRYVGTQVTVPGCDTTVAGNGTASLSKLPFDITPMSFNVYAAGCTAGYYEAALSIDPNSTSSEPFFAVPLGHTNLKIGNLGAVVANVSNPQTSDGMKLAVVGSIGTGPGDDSVLDMMLLISGSNKTLAGVVEGPLDMGALIQTFAPGVSLAGLANGHLGDVSNVIAVINSDKTVAIAFEVKAFGVDCVAQMTVGSESGPAKVTVYVQVTAAPSRLLCAHVCCPCVVVSSLTAVWFSYVAPEPAGAVGNIVVVRRCHFRLRCYQHCCVSHS